LNRETTAQVDAVTETGWKKSCSYNHVV